MTGPDDKIVAQEKTDATPDSILSPSLHAGADSSVSGVHPSAGEVEQPSPQPPAAMRDKDGVVNSCVRFEGVHSSVDDGSVREGEAPSQDGRQRVPRKIKALSPRELEVARLAAGGLQNKQIAENLGVSLETIRAHMRNIFLKWKINKRGLIAKRLLRVQ